MSPRLEIVDLSGPEDAEAFSADVREGLLRRRKALPPRWFYDAAGSSLFERITKTPEYYLSRTEKSILGARAAELAALCAGERSPALLVELGSGSSEKTRLVIAALLARQAELRYVAMDVSRAALLEAAPPLLRDFPGLSITALVGDYRQGLSWLARELPGARKLVLYLGSSLGNYAPAQARALLDDVSAGMRDGDRLVLGADLRKDPAVLEAAYNDAAGLTALFNLNLLRRVNDDLGGRFDPAAFAHRAFYNAAARKIEMHLESLVFQEVPVLRLGEAYRFQSGETIHTEDSHKYDVDELAALARAAGLRREAVFFDERRWFSVSLLEPS